MIAPVESSPPSGSRGVGGAAGPPGRTTAHCESLSNDANLHCYCWLPAGHDGAHECEWCGKTWRTRDWLAA